MVNIGQAEFAASRAARIVLTKRLATIAGQTACDRCTLGGTAGGMLGGAIAFALRGMSALIFRRQGLGSSPGLHRARFRRPGRCIGLLVV